MITSQVVNDLTRLLGNINEYSTQALRLLARVVKEGVQFWYNDTSTVKGGFEKTFLWKTFEVYVTVLHISTVSVPSSFKIFQTHLSGFVSTEFVPLCFGGHSPSEHFFSFYKVQSQQKHFLKGHSDKNQNLEKNFGYSLITLIIQYGRPLISQKMASHET